MILTDREIQTFLASRQIVIKPAPRPTHFSSTALDLTLAPQIRVWNFDQVKRARGTIINPGRGFKYFNFREKYTQKKRITKTGGYVLAPNDFILAWTRESIELPKVSRVAARVEGKSSLSRLGLAVHVTAPTIHAGFRGPIQLEMCNHGYFGIRLLPEMRICQVIFELTLGTPQKAYRGQFFRQDR